MSDPNTWEQVRRLKALLKIAYSALDDIYQRKGEGTPEMQAALALDMLDGLALDMLDGTKKWEDENE